MCVCACACVCVCVCAFGSIAAAPDIGLWAGLCHWQEISAVPYYCTVWRVHRHFDIHYGRCWHNRFPSGWANLVLAVISVWDMIQCYLCVCVCACVCVCVCVCMCVCVCVYVFLNLWRHVETEQTGAEAEEGLWLIWH